MDVYAPEFPPDGGVVWYRAFDKLPEFLRVVKFTKVAQFVHYDVVGKMRGKQSNLVIEA